MPSLKTSRRIGIALLCLVVLFFVAGFLAIGVYPTTSAARHRYQAKVTQDYSRAFTDLNNVLFSLGATSIRSDAEPGCALPKPDNAVEGLLSCGINTTGGFTASAQNVSDWQTTATKLNQSLSSHGWKYQAGYRQDITYTPIEHILELGASGPGISRYVNRQSRMNCSVQFDVNREYPHNDPRRIDINEVCQSDIL